MFVEFFLKSLQMRCTLGAHKQNLTKGIHKDPFYAAHKFYGTYGHVYI